MIYQKIFAAVAVTGIALLGCVAVAQPVEEIAITAPHEIVHKQVGRGSLGLPIETVTITHKVGYSDFNLKADSGVAALEVRIKSVAKQACHELDELYPDSRADNRRCEKSAIESAKAQMETAVATARN